MAAAGLLDQNLAADSGSWNQIILNSFCERYIWSPPYAVGAAVIVAVAPAPAPPVHAACQFYHISALLAVLALLPLVA